MNKKRKMFLPLLLAAGCFLVACSSEKIIARPDWIDYEIINGEGLKDNKLKRIYDAIKKLGDTNPNLLTKLLYEKIGQKQLGSFLQYDENNNLIPGIETYGSPAYDPDSSTPEQKQELKAFVNAHPFYKSSEKGVQKTSPDQEGEIKEFDEKDRLKVSYELIKDRRTKILNSIFEKLFNEINSGTYSIDNQFYEDKFLRSLRKQMYEVDPVDEIIATSGSEEIASPKELTPRRCDVKDQYGRHQLLSWTKYVNDSDIGTDNTEGFLHVFSGLDDELNNLTYYEDIAPNPHKMYKDYINRKILPEIYRETLTQIYVKDQNYSSLGRTYARKIQMISVSTGEHASNVYDMLHEYASDMNKTTGQSLYTFDDINVAMRGIISTGDEKPKKLLEAGGFEKIKVKNTTTGAMKELKWTTQQNPAITTEVYRGTALGDLVEKYMEVFNVTFDGSKFVFDTFSPTRNEETYKELTSNYSYSVQHGLELKEREIRLTNYTKDGWYLKNEGAEDLSDEFKKRLFDISTSKILDSNNYVYKDGDYTRKLKDGKYYLTNDKSTDPAKSIVLQEDGKMHIVEIEEAPSTSKLSTDINNKGSYLYQKLNAVEDPSTTPLTWSTTFRDNIVNDIVAKVSSGDTYKKNAEEYFLMVSNIIFYDEDVYDYFKSQYPDLF